MSYQAIIYRVLLSAPNDIVQEIRVVKESLDTWNIINSYTSKKYLELVHWSTHTYPKAGSSPQSIINKQIVNDADIIIALFWTRLGTATEDFESGTVEEIEKAISAGKSVMVYISKQPVLIDSVDIEQYNKVKEYLKSLKERVLYSEYSSQEELRELLIRHISQTINGEEEVLPELRDNQQSAMQEFYNRVDATYRKAFVEWTSEEKSEPVSTDDGKWIMKSIIQDLINYQSMITEDKTGKLSQIFEETIVMGKKLDKMQMYLDGGQSYREFWQRGNEILSKIAEILKLIKDEISD
jgi:hypothetical protein